MTTNEGEQLDLPSAQPGGTRGTTLREEGSPLKTPPSQPASNNTATCFLCRAAFCPKTS